MACLILTNAPTIRAIVRELTLIRVSLSNVGQLVIPFLRGEESTNGSKGRGERVDESTT